MKICLNMIVKNEEAVIERCLRSVLPFIDCWCIVDTGSTDATKDIVNRVLKEKPGKLYEQEWVNFGVNRTLGVGLAQKMRIVSDAHTGRFIVEREKNVISSDGLKADFILFMDADDQFVDSEYFNPYRLDKTKSHFVRMLLGDTEYRRMLIVPNTVQWSWEGVLHEYPVPASPVTSSDGVVPALTVKAGVEGARSRDPEKYTKDADMLKTELEKDPTNARNQFYYAQSLNHAGLYVEAFSAYQRRSTMGGFEEEAWYSEFQTGMMVLKIESIKSGADLTLRGALNRRPWRAEPALALARYYRVDREDYASAYAYASLAATTPYPVEDMLFVDKSVYQWAAKDEMAIAAYWIGRKAESRMLCLQLLDEKSMLPVSERERVKINLMHSF